jgi:hypothetical protein
VLKQPQQQQHMPVAFSSSSPRFGGSGSVTPTSPVSFRTLSQSPLQGSSPSYSWLIPPPPLLLPRSPRVGIALEEDFLGSQSAPPAVDGGASGGMLGKRRGSKRADGSPGGLVLAAAARIERSLLMEPED